MQLRIHIVDCPTKGHGVELKKILEEQPWKIKKFTVHSDGSYNSSWRKRLISNKKMEERT